MIPANVGVVFGPKFLEIFNEASQRSEITEETIGNHILYTDRELGIVTAIGSFVNLQLNTMIHHFKKDYPCQEGCFMPLEKGDPKLIKVANKCLEDTRNWLPFFEDGCRKAAACIQCLEQFQVQNQESQKLITAQLQQVNRFKEAVFTLTEELPRVINQLEEVKAAAEAQLASSSIEEEEGSSSDENALSVSSSGSLESISTDRMVREVPASIKDKRYIDAWKHLETIANDANEGKSSDELKATLAEVHERIRREVYKLVASRHNKTDDSKGSFFGKANWFKEEYRATLLEVLPKVQAKIEAGTIQLDFPTPSVR